MPKQEALKKLTSQQLARYFNVYEQGRFEASHDVRLERLAEMGASQSSFVLSTAQKTWLLSLNGAGKTRMEESGHSNAWNGLDVAIAHCLILEDTFGLNEEDIAAGHTFNILVTLKKR